jgi:hypothetical protein
MDPRADSSSPAPMDVDRRRSGASVGSNSSAGQSLAQEGMVFGESRTSLGRLQAQPPAFPRNSSLRNPKVAGERAKCQLFFLSKKDIASRWCLGNINGPSGTRFCMAERIMGPNKIRKSHCGIEQHSRKRGGSSKFAAQPNTFYINGGLSSSKASAKKDPSMHWSQLPANRCNKFFHGAKTLLEWTSLFIDCLDDVQYVASIQQTSSQASKASDDSIEEANSEEDFEAAYVAEQQERRVHSDWEANMDELSIQGSPSPSHRAAIELLCEASSSLAAHTRAQAEDLLKIWRLLDKESRSLASFEQAMGHIDDLAAAHGTVARAIETALASSRADDSYTFTQKLEEFQAELKFVAWETSTSKSALVALMTRIWETAKGRTDALTRCVSVLESQRDAHPLLGPTSSSSHGSGGSITADTVLGTSQVGGTPFELSMNSVFSLVKSLEAKIQVLTERSTNMGIIFGDLAFASEREFSLAFHAAKPEGKGPAGFVDIISIWHFAGLESSNVAAWLAEQKNARSVGFVQAVDLRHAHSMEIRYPADFACADKMEIPTTSTIEMLKSVKIWRSGEGRGYKDWLTQGILSAVRAHAKYCNKYMPAGWLREHALKSGQQTQHFWQTLAAYIKDEFILLLSFDLSEKNICLLMLHQIVQICNDLYEYRHVASNMVGGDTSAASRYAWVTLQVLNCMEGYLKVQF